MKRIWEKAFLLLPRKINKNSMKLNSFLILTLSLFLNTFSMEKVDDIKVYENETEINLSDFFENQDNLNVPELPEDILRVIFVFVKSLNFKTEEELFRTYNSIRLSNKFFKNLIDDSVRKSTNIPNFTYKQFLLTLAKEIICSKTQSYSMKDIVDGAKSFKAYKWSKDKRKSSQDYAQSLETQLQMNLRSINEVEEYLKLGEDPSAGEPNHMLYAITNGHIENVNLFLRYGVSPNLVVRNNSLLHHIVEALQSINEKSKEGDFANDLLIIAQALIENGADINFVNQQTLGALTPLQYAKNLVDQKTNKVINIEKEMTTFFGLPTDMLPRRSVIESVNKRTRPLYNQISNLKKLIKLFENYENSHKNNKKEEKI